MSRDNVVLTVAVAAIAAVGMAYLLTTPDRGPSNADVAARRLEMAGLLVVYECQEPDETTGLLKSFTASSRKISWDQANSLNVNSPEKSWRGMVKVYPDEQLGELPAYLKRSRWGSVWLIGDPELVDRITR